MGFLFDVDGRSVVPVRALPWVTGRDGDRWHFGAVEVARALACDAMFSSFAGVRARRADRSVFLASDWLELVSTLEARRAARDWDSDEWQVHATLLLPRGVYVDAAAWREAYQGCPDGPGPLLALLDDAADADPEDRADAEARSLDFDRDVPDEVRALIIEGFEAKVSMSKPSPSRKPLMEQNCERVLDALRSSGFDPLALPRVYKGKACSAKTAARSGAGLSDAAFDHAWRDLSAEQRIRRP